MNKSFRFMPSADELQLVKKDYLGFWPDRIVAAKALLEIVFHSIENTGYRNDDLLRIRRKQLLFKLPQVLAVGRLEKFWVVSYAVALGKQYGLIDRNLDRQTFFNCALETVENLIGELQERKRLGCKVETPELYEPGKVEDTLDKELRCDLDLELGHA